jgi:DNA repair protein RecO (recombination protein O)
MPTMALWTEEALILDAVDLQERDRIVTFLTRERGLKRGVASGARRKYSRFAGQLQPLAKARVTAFEKPGRDLVRLSSVEVMRSAGGLQVDLEGILFSSYLAEHLTVFAQEGEDSEHLFRLLDSTAEALLAGVEREAAVRYFEIWVLRLSGIFPSLDECAGCGRPLGTAGGSEAGGESCRLDAAAQAFTCDSCGVAAGALQVPGAALEWLRRTRHSSAREIAAAVTPAGVLGIVEEIAARMRRSFLQRELRSYSVMKRTLAEV